MRVRPLPTLAVLVAAFALASLAGLSCASREAASVGLVGGRLAPCPSSPNCVSSTDPDASKRVAALALAGEPRAAFATLLERLRVEPGWSLERVEGDWAHLVYRSGLFGFRDDVELVLDPASGRVDLRSASRVGWWDLGANRRRAEWLRAFATGRSG